MKSLINIMSFLQVAEHQSFGRAGKQLNLSTSAISKGVARLEADLGVQLLHRTTRTTNLTEAGHRYYEGCKQMLLDLEGLEAEIRGEADSTKGVLKIGAPVSLGRACLPYLLKQFSLLQPELRIEVTFDRGELCKGEVDVFLGPTPAGTELRTHKLSTYPLIVCAAPVYLEERGRPFHPRDLARQVCLGGRNTATGQLYSWYFTLNGKLERLDFPEGLVLNDADSLHRAALAGLGVTQLPGYLAGESLSQGSLVEILAPYRPSEIPITVSYLNRQFTSKRIQLFVEYVLSCKDAIAATCQSGMSPSPPNDTSDEDKQSPEVESP